MKYYEGEGLALREARLRLSVQEEKAKASMQEVANLTLQTNSLEIG